MIKTILKILENIIKLIALLTAVIIIWYGFKPSILESKLKIGMSESDVLTYLGPPTFSSSNQSDFCINKFNKLKLCNEISISKSEKITYWKEGVDSWIVVGFDKRNKVCYKSIFDS